MFVDPCIIIRSINNQLDAVFSFFYFCYTLYMFRVPFAPIIKSILKTVHAAWCQSWHFVEWSALCRQIYFYCNIKTLCIMMVERHTLLTPCEFAREVSLEVWKAYCFSTATVVMRKHFNVTCVLTLPVLLQTLVDLFSTFKITKNSHIKVNVYLPSLMMKVPDHVYVLGPSYTCHTLIKYNRYA
jgi:tRNA G10  N-methylase Trm11